MSRDGNSRIPDEDWANVYSGLSDGDRRLLADLRAHDPSDDDFEASMDTMADYYSDRFQNPETGLPYKVTVEYDAPTVLEARLLADLVRATVRKAEHRVPCRACGGSRYVPIRGFAAYLLSKGKDADKARRRCTACTDGTAVENPAVVTFEASGEVGSECLVVER